ncbi:hypothetical protein MMSR116_15850 [Methylobacterium mesophilicum SR1.6/6]|uniref:Uncharacterized protein n=1 Tax=Methylobacterium mesophilicum SR1.6/6 TaxID=908290 RepID=A0A6B9FKX7_9HYPH|nr:hypothetical protein [Methylobacterium mesophilicum]QGY03193.1 hypothetical protein MMSR116_15850 [Methylobacterium mesophilicum SR1.6/6]
MTMLPAERVAGVLLEAGYRRLDLPLQIAGLSFDVAGAFVGVGHVADLVVIGDTGTDTERKVVQQIEGISRALDVMRSQRPLTSVILGPRPVGKALDAIAQVSRILAVGEADDPVGLRDGLAILLPLKLPAPRSADRDLGAGEHLVLPDVAIASDLYEASALGEDAVRACLHDALNAIFEPEPEPEKDGSMVG